MTIALILYPLHTAEKEDFRRNFVYLNDRFNELTRLNTMLKNSNKELSKKLHLSSIEKEQIQLDFTKPLKAATVSNNWAIGYAYTAFIMSVSNNFS